MSDSKRSSVSGSCITLISSFLPNIGRIFSFPFATLNRALFGERATYGWGKRSKGTFSVFRLPGTVYADNKLAQRQMFLIILSKSRCWSGSVCSCSTDAFTSPKRLVILIGCCCTFPQAATARARKQTAKKVAGSQLSANAKAMTIVCQICRTSFMCTTNQNTLKEHVQNRHSKNTYEECFPA